MGNARSLDLRCRVVAAVDAGVSRRQVAARFGVGESSTIRRVAQTRSTSDAAPKPRGCARRASRIDPHRDLLTGWIDGEADLTLWEIAATLGDAVGYRPSPSVVHGFFKAYGSTRKKTAHAAAALGSMTGTSLLAYVEQVLVPTLKPTDVVVMDNLRAHKPVAIREAIQVSGASSQFLPRYNTDFNRSETAFSKIKASLKKATARTGHSRWDATRDVIDAVIPVDAQGYITACDNEAERTEFALYDCILNPFSLESCSDCGLIAFAGADSYG